MVIAALNNACTGSDVFVDACAMKFGPHPPSQVMSFPRLTQCTKIKMLKFTQLLWSCSFASHLLYTAATGAFASACLKPLKLGTLQACVVTSCMCDDTLYC